MKAKKQSKKPTRTVKAWGGECDMGPKWMQDAMKQPAHCLVLESSEVKKPVIMLITVVPSK